MKLILNAFSLYFVIGHSVFDIGYSSLKLIAMGIPPYDPAGVHWNALPVAQVFLKMAFLLFVERR